MWLSPDEFLAVSVGDHPALLETLEAALGDERGYVVDLISNRAIVKLSGVAAPKVLLKVTPPDLRPRAVGANRAITATVAPIPLLLSKTYKIT